LIFSIRKYFFRSSSALSTKQAVADPEFSKRGGGGGTLDIAKNSHILGLKC
jgi:hypothetical protein